MVRGKSKFICKDCGYQFIGLDIEWLATAETYPEQCPNCGSMHTVPRPYLLLDIIFKKVLVND